MRTCSLLRPVPSPEWVILVHAALGADAHQLPPLARTVPRMSDSRPRRARFRAGALLSRTNDAEAADSRSHRRRPPVVRGDAWARARCASAAAEIGRASCRERV